MAEVVAIPTREPKAGVRPISLVRFNALAGYCRQPLSDLYGEELKWFEHGGERLLATLIRDRQDDDYGGVILARDQSRRFRWVGDCGAFYESPRSAEAALRFEMERLAAQPDEEYHQGDERGSPVDFFSPRVPREQLNINFVRLAAGEGFSLARGIIEPMMHWYEDLDGNFVEQFQTVGFDARIWELYLFATFVEMGYRIERIHAVPDFACVGLLGELCVEAVTVGPTRDQSGAVVPPPRHDTPEAMRLFEREYMPIKYGSALTSKLAKRYWERAHVAGKPLLFAIQDFHAPMSMVRTGSGLPIHLYGYDQVALYDSRGRLQTRCQKVERHRWGDKSIPSGFFDLPGAENVSAVLFSNSGTISKFNRMGLLAGFGSRRVVLVRQGLAYDFDPEAAKPRPFRHVVNAPGYVETWVEGLSVFHNPRARYPLKPAMLPGAAHHRLLPDGRIESLVAGWHPMTSVTLIFVGEDARLTLDRADGRSPPRF